MVETSRWKSCFFSPSGQTLRFTTPSDVQVVPLVPVLFFSRAPTAITRVVWFVVVLPLNHVLP
jgi:hypothetical protein